MMTTIEYLDALKAKTGATSDYALAKKMNVTRAAISSYRIGRSNFDDTTCVKVASILEIDPFVVIAAMNAERAKTDANKALWKGLFERLGGVAATLLLATTVNTLTPSNANAGAVSPTSHPSDRLYIMLNRKRNNKPKKRPLIDLSFMVENLLSLA